MGMKSLLLVFAVVYSATADPAADADPAFAYTVGSLLLTYSYAPLTYVVPAAGCRNNLGAVVPCNGAVPFLAPIAAAAAPAEAAAEEAPAVEAVDRRRRDADADADPAILYSASYIHHPVTYSYAAYPYAYHALPYAYYGRKKRDADADADALLYYSTYGYAPYAYHGYVPYAYALAGCRNNQGALVPCAGR